MAVAMIGPKFYAWDRNGKPLAFGKLYTYQARTNTPKPTYQSEDQQVENTNPVILNGEGYANIYLDGSYKMVLKDDKDNEIWSSDPVSSTQPDEWVNCAVATYVSPTAFNVGGNFTDIYQPGRRVRIDSNTSEYAYSTVETSAYAGGFTSITVIDSVITTGIQGVCASIIGPDSRASDQVLNFDSLDNAVSSTLIRLGDSINLKERSVGYGGGGFWDVVELSSVTTNGYDIVAASGVQDLALVLRIGVNYIASQFGAISDWDGAIGTDSTDAIQACIDAVSNEGTVIIDGDFMYSKPLTTKANTTYKITGGGLLAAKTDVAADTFNLSNGNVWIDGLRFKNNDREVVGGATIINLVGGSNYKVTNCTFDSNMTADVNGTPGVTDVEVSSNTHLPKSQNVAFAITMNGVERGIITNNIIGQSDAGIVLLNDARWFVISGNIIDDSWEIGIDLIQAQDISLSNNIINSSRLSGLRISLTPVAGFPLAISKRISSVGDIFNDCGTDGAGAIEINSNDSTESGGHRITSPIIRCASAGIASAIGCAAPNCIVTSPEISGPHLVGVNVQDRAINFKLLGGTIRGSLDTGVKLFLLSGSPVNGDARVEVSGVTIDAPGAASDGIGMTIANVGNSKITNNNISFGANTKWGFRFSGGQLGLALSSNSVIGTSTMADAYSTGTASFLDDVTWDGNKLGTQNVDQVSGAITIPDGQSSASVAINMIKTLFATVSPRANEMVWISSISITSITVSRVGTSGSLLVHYQGKVSQS